MRVDLERDGVGALPNIPEKLMPREVLGRDLEDLPSLSEPDDFDAFSSGSLSEALRADLERDNPDGRSLTGEDASAFDRESFFELDGGGGAAPQKPHDLDS